MAYLADFKFLEKANTPTESNIFYTKSDGEEIVLTVDATASSFQLNI